jgi:hypothetical protein
MYAYHIRLRVQKTEIQLSSTHAKKKISRQNMQQENQIDKQRKQTESSSHLFSRLRKNNAMRLIDNYNKLLLVLKISFLFS